MTCRKLLRNTDVALPCGTMNRQQCLLYVCNVCLHGWMSVKLQLNSMIRKKEKKKKTKKAAPKIQKNVMKHVILQCSLQGLCSSRWEFLQSGNSGPTCCAYSRRETRYGAGGSRPGYTALLIESKASVKSPHSIIVPTLLKSVSVAWRNKGVRGVWKGGENTALKEMDGAKEEKKARAEG